MLTLRSPSIVRHPRAIGPAIAALVVAVNLALVATVSLGGERAPLAIGAMAVALLMGVPFIRALVQRPQRGILLLAALLPFHGLLTLTPFSGALTGWKEVLAGAAFAATFVAPRAARALPGRRIPAWAVPLGGFVGLGVISAAAQHDLQGLVGLKVTFFYLVLALTIWRCPLEARERERFVTILMVTGVVTAAFGVVQQVLGGARLVALGWEYNTNVRTSGGLLRAFSTFNTNFPFSLFLMMVLLVGLPVALSAPRRRRNRLFLYATPIVLAGMVSSLTRGGWVGLVVGLLYLGAVRYPILSNVTLRLMVVGAIALAFVAGYSASFLASESGEDRITILEQNFPAIAQHPLGLGIGATGSAAEKVAELQDTTATTVQPDDYYLKVALELGVVGLWLFVLFFVSAGSTVHRRARALREPGDVALAYGTGALLLGAAVVSLLATFLEVFPLDAYFWILLAIVATCDPESP
jgi:hypothetical protein